MLSFIRKDAILVFKLFKIYISDLPFTHAAYYGSKIYISQKFA